MKEIGLTVPFGGEVLGEVVKCSERGQRSEWFLAKKVRA
jgi:hypothetical protein